MYQTLTEHAWEILTVVCFWLAVCSQVLYWMENRAHTRTVAAYRSLWEVNKQLNDELDRAQTCASYANMSLHNAQEMKDIEDETRQRGAADRPPG